MKMFSKRTVLCASIAASALAATTACGAVEGDSGSDGSLPVVKFAATAMPSSIGTVAAVIEAENLDEACGINLDPLSFAPDAAETAVLSGQADVGYFGFNSWAGSEEKLSKLAMLAPLQTEHGVLFVPEDSSAQSLEDLKGKKIALLPPVSGQFNDFQMLVAQMGMDLESDFETVTGPPPAIEAFLKRGEVDAAILFEPNATNLELGGGYRPLFALDAKWEEITGNPLYMLGITANQEWFEGHAEEAACAVEAIQEAGRLLAEDASVYEGLAEDLGAKDDEHLSLLTENLGSIYSTETAAEAEPAVAEQLKVAKELGLVPSVPEKIFESLEG